MANSNEDEITTPHWLDKDFFLKALKHKEKNQSIKIENLKLRLAVSNDEHFASVIYRAMIEYSDDNYQCKSISLILKTSSQDEGRRKEILESSRIFETESSIYTETIPKIEDILRASGDTTKLGPTVIYHGLSPNKFIIFEDLVPLGYTTLSGNPSLEIVEAAYKKLARLHAVSFKLIKEEPERFDSFRYGMLSSFEKSDLFQKGTINFIDMLGKHADLAQYKPYFESLHQDNLQGRAVAAVEQFWKSPEKETLYVLCHGDFHSKNLMIRCDKNHGKLEDLMLLDYQFSYVGPIAHDLIYSILTIMSDEQRSNNLDELLYDYFKNFKQTLLKIGYSGPIPKIQEFLQQISQQKSFALFLMTTFMPAWYSFMQPHLDLKQLSDPVERQKAFFSNPAYLKSIRQILPRLLHWGYLEQ